MNLGDIYNSVSKGVSNLTSPISSFFSTSPVMAKTTQSPPPTIPTSYPLSDRGVSVSEDDLKAMRPLIYGEVSNRTPDKQALEANVIMNTAINRVKANTDRGTTTNLSKIIAEPNQYQAYGGKQYQEYYNPPDVPSLAKKQQVDAIMNDIAKKIKSGNYPDTTEGAYFYKHNPDQSIIYDNKRKLFK